MNDLNRDQHDDQQQKKPRRTGYTDAPASAPEVRQENVIPPEIPHTREEGLSREQIEEELDQGIDESFPASDPPSIVSPHAPSDRPVKEEGS